MKINVIIPYRPLSRGSLSCPPKDIYQLPDGRWLDDDGEYRYGGHHRYGHIDELDRAIRFLNKNSYYRHNIIVAIDNDVHPNDKFLKEFDNVSVLKAKYIHKGEERLGSVYRENAAFKEAIESIPDEEWLCYSYISDLICCKDWDKPVIDTIKQYGEKYVYVPMFTEVRAGTGSVTVSETETTPEKIWDEWRRTVCCHALTMPIPKKGYFTENDINNYIEIANRVNKGIITEKPGERIYGYYASLFMKAKYGKIAMRVMGPGFDLDFDNRLYSECNLMKKVITNSFVFHPFCEFKEI